MTGCSEFILDDVLAVTAIPVTDMPADNPSSPVNSLEPTIRANGFRPVLTHAVTIGLRPATDGGALIPVIRHTGKARDEESDSVAGRLHTVTVTCEIDSRDGTVWADLLMLERTPSHLVLTFRDGVTRAFVSASRDTYTCSTGRDGAKTTVTLGLR